MGVLLGLSRLAADSEIIAMRASGLGIGYFVRVRRSWLSAALCWAWEIRSIWLPRANQAILDMEQVAGDVAGLLRDSAAHLL